ncbi:MAG: cardiolipin synthase [Phyllobacteriaceae bacterium]|nr:cardiolipin synthase [Phyllobacteriaceae bacterium]
MTVSSSLAFALSAGLFLLQVVGALVALRAIRTARTPQGAVGWAIFLLAVPSLALPAYVIFGDVRYPGMVRKRKLSETTARGRRRPAAAGPRRETSEGERLRHGFEAIAEEMAVEGNAVELLAESEAVFRAVFAAIGAAHRRVVIETYILRDDGLGHALQELLLRKAGEGVRVCVLYDPFGSHGLHRDYLARMRAGGVEIVDFHARHRTRLLTTRRLNFRNHRKIAVIDGAVAFTGGYNWGDEYVGRDPRLGAWRDTSVRLEGPVAARLEALFAEDWHWATGEVLDLGRPAAAIEGGVSALALATGPADPREPGSLYFEHAITAARRRIWIASPYFAPDPGLMTALRVAVLRGVDVRVLMAGRRDHWLVWLAAFAFLDEMRGSGVAVHRWQGGFMHQKVLLVDDVAAAVGSHNLDARSCRLNFEASTVIFDEAFARRVEAMLEADFAAAPRHDRALSEEPPALRLAAPVARLFAPIL